MGTWPQGSSSFTAGCNTFAPPRNEGPIVSNHTLVLRSLPFPQFLGRMLHALVSFTAPMHPIVFCKLGPHKCSFVSLVNAFRNHRRQRRKKGLGIVSSYVLCLESPAAV